MNFLIRSLIRLGILKNDLDYALCELNYTPQESDGSIDISKALQVNTEFDLSRQFWAYLVKKGAIKDRISDG